MDQQTPPATTRPGVKRSPQNVIAGLILFALAAMAFWLLGDLSQGTLRAIGPALLPRALAVGVGLCGIGLTIAGLSGAGDVMERWTLRGPLFVVLAVSAFALTIRPVQLGSLATPGLGLAVAGPLAILISGFATPGARIRELMILALSLTAFCMVLFGDVLNLPIPVFPQSLTDLLPDDWTQRTTLRATAVALVAGAIIIWLIGRMMPAQRTAPYG